MLIYVQPWLTRPELAMASAASMTFWPVTAGPKQLQLFQPSAGARQIVSPTTIFNVLSAEPSEFLACSFTRCSPLASVLPVIKPLFGSRVSPAGKPSAENSSGRLPVVATVKRNGCPGRTPKIFAELIRGVSASLGVRTTFSSSDNLGISGLSP